MTTLVKICHRLLSIHDVDLLLQFSDSDSESFIRHCLSNNRIAQIFIIDARRLPLRQLVVADMGAT